MITGQITLTKEIIESETNLLFVCQPFLSLSKNTDFTCQNIHFLQIVPWIFFILRRFLKNSAIFVKKISSVVGLFFYILYPFPEPLP